MPQNMQTEFFDGDFVMNFLQKVNNDELVYSDTAVFPPGCGATNQPTACALNSYIC